MIVNKKKFDTASITKLNGDNYRVWKMRLTSLFDTHSILEIVDGTTKRPAAPGKEQKDWDRGNKEAFTALLMSISDEEVETISSCKTAVDIWKKLGTMYL
jgi:hypothetical protein